MGKCIVCRVELEGGGFSLRNIVVQVTSSVLHLSLPSFYIQPSHQFLIALSSDNLLHLVPFHPSGAFLGISLPVSSFASLQSVLYLGLE